MRGVGWVDREVWPLLAFSTRSCAEDGGTADPGERDRWIDGPQIVVKMGPGIRVGAFKGK